MTKKKSKNDPEQEIFGGEEVTVDSDGEGNRDTMSLILEPSPAYGSVTYTRIDRKLMVAHTNDNPLLIFKKSPRIMNMIKLAQQEYLMRRIDQFIPLIVKKVGDEYRYLGDLETLSSVEKYLESIGRDEIWCAVIGENYPDTEVSKLWAELNLSNPVPDPLYRLFLYRHHINKNLFSKRDLKRFLNIKQSNGKEAKQIDRDYSLCSSDILYSAVTGISMLDEERGAPSPSPMKAKMSYTQGLLVAEILGKNIDVQKVFEEKLDAWIEESKELQLESDTVKPMPERVWYIRSKPEEIARGVVGQKRLPLKFMGKESLSWPVRVIDENKRLLKVPDMVIDLKRKDDADIKLLIEFYIKSESLAQTIGSYLKTICPVEHGGVIRGRAANDDSSLELRSNMSEFYNSKYIRTVFKRRMLRYCNPHGFLMALGLSLKSFGFETESKPISLQQIRRSFSDWSMLNHDKFIASESLPNVPIEVLGNTNILKHLSQSIDKHAPSDSDVEISFESFFQLIFSLVFKAIQKEWNASCELINSEDFL